MIDIHTHILPYMDDGAKDSETALRMLEMESEQGVSTLLFSPHYYGKRSSPKDFLEKRQEMYAHIQSRIPPTINTRLAAEVHYTGINPIENDDMCSLAIAGTEYVLVEFPFTAAWTASLMERLAQFVYDTGYTPIIAHVERYQEVRKNPAFLTELVKQGCLLQVNTGAFLDKKDRKFAFSLLEHGLVHCMGTDSHDAENRAPDYVQAKQVIEKAGCAGEFAQIQENMHCILENQAVEIPAYKPLKKFFGFYL